MDISSAFSDALAPFSAVLTGAVDAISAVVAGLKGINDACTGVIDSVRGFTRQVDGFVAALSPGTMLQFNRAIQDVYATIGTAFLPMFQVFTNALRDIAGELLPAMEALAPVVKALAESIVNLVLPYVRIVSQVIQALVPILQLLADFIGILVDAMQPLFAVVIALVQAFGTLIAQLVNSLRPFLEQFATIVKQATDALIKFIVMLGKALGANQFVADFIAALKPEHKQGQTAAGNVSLKNVDRLNKDIQQLAFAASGAGEGKEKKSDTDRLIDELKNINPTESVQDIANTLKAILKLAQDIYDHTVGVVKGALGSTAQAVANDKGGGPFGGSTADWLANHLGLTD